VAGISSKRIATTSTASRARPSNAGVRKPRELEHDSQIYDAFLEAAERLHAADARIERVVLDYELKREYQCFLQERNRDRRESDGRPDRDPVEIEAWARAHDLPYFDDQVHFPDVRIEYEDLDGRTRQLDVEVTTVHYRGAHGAAAARSGFSQYRGGSARIFNRSSGADAVPADAHGAWPRSCSDDTRNED
jgi:hypothetical protein